MNIGNKISRCRKKSGMSQEALAAELGISRQAVSRWERGESIPDTEKIISLCTIFHVSADYLLFDEIEEEIKKNSDLNQTHAKNSSTAKAHFRIVVYIIISVAGVLLIVSALILALIETYQPYQTYYPAWGPFGTYLFRTWRVVPFVLGIFMTIIGIICLYNEYKKM